VTVLTAHASVLSAAVSVFFAVDEPDKSVVTPGVAGFLVTFGLALATLFLIRSMVKHLRKVRYSPEPGEQPRVPGPRPEAIDRREDHDPGEV
jgi:hypothetical protein